MVYDDELEDEREGEDEAICLNCGDLFPPDEQGREFCQKCRDWYGEGEGC